ncbi:MAG: hypothetical protein U0136_01265 [Bdellovibrionota bacterium]
MSPAGFNFSSIVDIGFVLLVTAACLKGLSTGASPAERVAERWRNELRELEKVLRNLISEASTASSSLDRRLLRRKAELEQLLKQIENGAPVRAASKPKPAAKPAGDTWELGEIGELPNDSWKVAAEQSAEETGTEESFDPGDTSELDELMGDTVDSVSLSRASQQLARTAAPKAPMPSILRPPAQKTLSSKIEIIKSPAETEEKTPEEIAEEKTFSKMSIMDPTAYRIARRLLASGTEIHIVARKLDLPASEVRLLDKLMRQEGRPDGVSVGANYKPTETVPASKIVRSRTAQEKVAKEKAGLSDALGVVAAKSASKPSGNAFQAVELTAAQVLEHGEALNESLEYAIEREVALL